ncbi:MAG: ABC transporter transmembrane domain-containing protein [Pseudomonadota bacterium]
MDPLPAPSAPQRPPERPAPAARGPGWLPHASALAGCRTWLAQVLIAGLALELFALLLPVFWQLFFDRVLVSRDHNLLHVIGIAMIVGALSEGVLLYFVIRRGDRLASTVDRALTGLVLRKLLQLPLQYFERLPKGAIAAQVGEVGPIRLFLASTGVQFVTNLVMMSLILGLMAWYNLLLAGIVALCVPVLIGLSMLLRKAVEADFTRQRATRDALAGVLNQGLNHVFTIKSMALEKSWLERWTQASSAAIDASSHTARLQATEAMLLRVVQRLVVLAVLWIGGLEFLGGRLSAGQLVACYMFCLRVLEPCTRMFRLGETYIRYRQAARHMGNLLGESGERQGNAMARAPRTDSLSIENLSFRYPGTERQVLHGLNLELRAGMTAGIIGASGCGKTTLSRLLQRHLVPDSGGIRINGVDIREFDLASLRRRVVLLTHDAALFDTSIAANIVGEHPRDDVRLRRCCELSMATELLAQLPEGVETLLHEGGPSLSLGQRQRIALARALYSGPELLILDEATNGLDALTESAVLRNVAGAMRDGILVVITHRAHLLNDFDWVGALADGRLLAQAGAEDPQRAGPAWDAGTRAGPQEMGGPLPSHSIP